MPGGTRHSAGGSQALDTPTWGDALATVQLSSFREALAVPCIRQSLMIGIASGFFGGGAFWISGRSGIRAVNAAMAAFFVGSPVSFAACDWQRRREKRRVRVVKEAWEERRREKQVEWETYRERRLVEVEREERDKSRAVRKDIWWPVWDWGSGTERGREG
jgi:cytochrome c oxidase assembly protein subunit 20